MEIRFAKAQDVPGIIKLLQQVGDVHHRGRPDIFRTNAQKYGASQVIAMLDKPNAPIFVAVDDDTVVGYAFCIRQVQTAASMQKISTLYVDDLCVDAAMRGRGIGKVLYDYAVKYARENGYYNLTLNVWACNPSAMRFYEKCGLAVQKVGMELVL